MNQEEWDRDLAAYRQARLYGIQPETTRATVPLPEFPLRAYRVPVRIPPKPTPRNRTQELEHELQIFGHEVDCEMCRWEAKYGGVA